MVADLEKNDQNIFVTCGTRLRIDWWIIFLGKPLRSFTHTWCCDYNHSKE